MNEDELVESLAGDMSLQKLHVGIGYVTICRESNIIFFNDVIS